MMTREEVIEVMRAWREAFDAGDWSFFERLFADDVEMTWHGPQQAFPVPSAVYGKKAALDAMRQIADALVVARNVIRVVMVDGDWAAVIMDRTVMQRGTGRTLVYKVAAFFRFQQGRVAEYQAFYDSFDMLEQVIGRTLDVPQGYPP